MKENIYFCERYGQLGDKNSYVIKYESERIILNACKSNRISVIAWFQDWIRYALLPQGYPSSVSSDYLSYQLWDTLQAFCSYLSGTLTTKAVMQGVGVGDAMATPLAATITWIIRDGTGMLGRILFASWKGPSLDANCKQWRLAADVLNDIAMTIELCSPMLPGYLFSSALCMATSIKSIVGVAGGATRAALTQHQACRDNMADVAAKDGSQETLVNLVASVAGIFLLPLLTTHMHVWLLFVVMTCTHLFANFKAVRALNIPILNEQRFNLVLSSYLKTAHDIVEPPHVVNASESVFLGTGLRAKMLCGFDIHLGASLASVQHMPAALLRFVCSLSTDYLVLPCLKTRTIAVVFQQDCSPDPLRAYFHAIILGSSIQQLAQSKYKQQPQHWANAEHEVIFKALSRASNKVADEYLQFISCTQQSGWVTSRHQLLVDEWQAEWQLTCKKLD